MNENAIGLRDNLKDLLTMAAGYPCFYKEADVGTEYPYAVFEYRRLSSDGGIENYALEVNGWDKAKTESRISTIMDKIEKLDKTKTINAYRSFTIHKDSREGVLDEDKEIKRIRSLMDLTVCERRA